MKSLLNQQCKNISGRMKVAKAPAAGAITQNNITLSPDNPILLDMVIFAAPSTISPKDMGIRISTGGRIIYPAFGSADDSSFTGPAAGWGALPTSGNLSIDELNVVLEGPPYNVLIEAYNGDTATDGYVFVTARTTPKVDLPILPIVEKTGPEAEAAKPHEQPSYNRVQHPEAYAPDNAIKTAV